METAQELGVSIDGVYVAKSRVLKRLREEILLLAEDLPQCVPLTGPGQEEPGGLKSILSRIASVRA